MTNYSLGKSLLTIENLSLQYGDKKILRDINIQILDILGDSLTGQVCTLVGKSGVGKSQLFGCIAGLVKPTSGTVKIGLDQHPTAPGLVGMVAQNYPLFAHRTLQGNLELVSKDKEKIEYYLNEFDLIQRRDLYPPQLSGGQRQRTAIIQQLLCSEHFILLDEPFSGLDPLATSKLCDVIIKVANMDDLNTIIISSHVLEPSIAVSDHVWILGNKVDPQWGGEQDRMIPGATIAYVEDLAAQGLAWRHDIYTDPAFVALCNKIRGVFKTI